MTIRTMYDSASWQENHSVIPRDAQMAALYYNGRYAASQREAAAYFSTHTALIWIDVLGTAPTHCQVADVEPGDIGPDETVTWVKRRLAAVHTSLPTLYCNRSQYSTVHSVMARAGLQAGKDYWYWVATGDDTTSMNGLDLREVPGVAAVQNHFGPDTGADTSIVFNPEWHPCP